MILEILNNPDVMQSLEVLSIIEMPVILWLAYRNFKFEKEIALLSQSLANITSMIVEIKENMRHDKKNR